MGFIIEDKFPPILIARRTGELNAEGMAQMLGELGGHLRAADSKRAVIYDAPSGAGRPNAASRQVAGTWIRDEQGLLVRRCVGLDFAFPSPISRGVLTAIFWIARPPVPIQMHETFRLAVEAATARVGREDLIAEILRARGGS